MLTAYGSRKRAARWGALLVSALVLLHSTFLSAVSPTNAFTAILIGKAAMDSPGG